MSDNKVYTGKKGSKYNTSRSLRSGKRARKRPQNPYELEDDKEATSTSAKKLMSGDENEIHVDSSFGYRFIDFITVFTAISELVVCKTCGSNVKFVESSSRGLGYKVVVTCEKCSPHFINASPLINHAYDINRRIVFVMRLLGVGLNGIRKFCAFMCLPNPLFQSFYGKINANFAVATAAVRESSIRKAAAREIKLSRENGQTEGISVSGDGTWRKRGFSSLLGVTSLVGWFSKQIVDIEVMSKFCKACNIWENKAGTAEYEEWAESHNETCERNHEGSSGQIEVDAVVDMFQRSEKLHGVKYCNYIGDGDSKTFKGIMDATPYTDFTVKKRECVDCVQKRMGSRLRNLRITKSLGGEGKLPGKLIDELTLYYGLAIRRNHDSVDNMKKEIWATLFHRISSDDNPQHDNCPVGANSWCSWQKARATSQLSTYCHKPPMSMDLFQAIEPIYKELTRDDLLSRCLGGFTQNCNESYNSVLWAMAPKHIHSDKKVVEIAADIAVCNFNNGLKSIMEIMQVLNLAVGRTCFDFCTSADARRISRAEHAMSDEAREARRESISTKKIANEYKNLEDVFYGAGIAD